ncbi:hypothetical protein ACIGXM_28345 [Kitasatospora sp. NPDC052896]|uniref:hypothetical protein n=1 Tax=Kitasatospora sp. NPDC052896 TaxID=3364061 RepID=UPI0037C69719
MRGVDLRAARAGPSGHEPQAGGSEPSWAATIAHEAIVRQAGSPGNWQLKDVDASPHPYRGQIKARCQGERGAIRGLATGPGRVDATARKARERERAALRGARVRRRTVLRPAPHPRWPGGRRVPGPLC